MEKTLREERLNEFAIFRRNLKILRAFKNISSEELSKAIGSKTIKRVADFECGRCFPTFEEIIKIAKLFDVTIDNLMYKNIMVSFE